MQPSVKQALVAVLELELRGCNVELTHAQRVDVVDALLKELVSSYYQGQGSTNERSQNA